MSSQVLIEQVPSTQELALTAWVRLLRTHAALKREFNAKLQAEHGLTVNDYEALLLLSHEPDQRLKRVVLADRLQLTPSGVTRLLDGLEASGHVEKASCDSDARITYAVLTDSGRQKLERASCSHVAGVRELFGERLDDDELRQLGELLSRLPGGSTGSGECAVGSADPS
jgi:DNA-binding MarR family transcriptional regulator